MATRQKITIEGCPYEDAETLQIFQSALEYHSVVCDIRRRLITFLGSMSGEAIEYNSSLDRATDVMTEILEEISEVFVEG